MQHFVIFYDVRTNGKQGRRGDYTFRMKSSVFELNIALSQLSFFLDIHGSLQCKASAIKKPLLRLFEFAESAALSVTYKFFDRSVNTKELKKDS